MDIYTTRVNDPQIFQQLTAHSSREACPRDRLCAFFHRRAERRRPPPDGALGNAGKMVGKRLVQWELAGFHEIYWVNDKFMGNELGFIWIYPWK